MLTNPMETQMVRSLGVKIGGRKEPNVSVILGVAIVVGLLAATWYSHRLRMGDDAAGDGVPPPATNADGSGRFRALSIRFGPDACEAARSLHGARFLASAEAPSLPLADCNAERCRCRLVHHRDRRTGDDRRSPYQGGYGGSATRIGEDRRVTGRRSDDEAIAPPGQ